MLRIWQCSIHKRRTTLMSLWISHYRSIVSTSVEGTSTINEGHQEHQQQQQHYNNLQNGAENNEKTRKTHFYNSNASHSEEHQWECYHAYEGTHRVELMKCHVVKEMNENVKLRQEEWMEMEPQDKCTILYKLGLHALELIEYDNVEEHKATNAAQRIKGKYKQLQIKWCNMKEILTQKKSLNAEASEPRKVSLQVKENTNSENADGATNRLCVEETSHEAKLNCSHGRQLQEQEMCQSARCKVLTSFPYVMRLKLSLSFAMWISTLRHVQLEFVSSKLPYAPTRRVNRTRSSLRTHKNQDTLAFLYPSCLFDKLINWSTELVVRINSNCNPTALQAPAPHTWQSDVEWLTQDESLQSNNNNEYLENEENKNGLLPNRRSARRPFTHFRGNKQQTNKNATAIISRRVRALRAAHKAPHRAGADDSIWAITHAQYQRRARRHHDGLLFTEMHQNAPWQSTSGWTKFIAAQSKQKGAAHHNPELSISCSSDNFIHFDTNATNDAIFHGNHNREDGCPVNNHGTSSATPIFIQVNEYNDCNTHHEHNVNVHKYEALTHYCVMAHAAVLTSLFIEGRVVHFFTDSDDVYQYVTFVFQELIERQCVSVQHVEYVRTLTITPETENDKCTSEESRESVYSDNDNDNNANNESVYLMPYYPAYAQPKLSNLQESLSRHALILTPPEDGEYNKNLVNQLARLIVQAAPCTVLVESFHEEQESAEEEEQEQNLYSTMENKRISRCKCEYIKQIRKEVNVIMADLFHKEEQQRQVKWEPIPAQMETCKKREMKCVRQMPKEVKQSNKETTFQPKLQTKKEKQSKKWLSATDLINYLQHLLNSNVNKNVHNKNKSSEYKNSSVSSFLQALSESNALNHYYSLQFLTSSNSNTQQKVLQREMYNFLNNKLPSNVRVVGINTSPFDILYYYPHAPFLQYKVGNSQRYKAVDLTVISRSASFYEPDNLKLFHASRHHEADSNIFSSLYSLSDKINLSDIERTENSEHINNCNDKYVNINTKNDDTEIKNAETVEQIVQYLITYSTNKAVFAIIMKMLHLEE